MPKRSLLLLLAAMLACPLPAYADTVTIGYFDPAAELADGISGTAYTACGADVRILQ
jgi:hypothetical protein